MVPVSVCDVDLPQLASRRRDPVADIGRLLGGQRWIDQDSVTSPRDQCRGDRRPHPCAAVGQRPPSRLRDLRCDENFVAERSRHDVTTPLIASVKSRTIAATAPGRSTCTQWPPSSMTFTSARANRGPMVLTSCSVTNASAPPRMISAGPLNALAAGALL